MRIPMVAILGVVSLVFSLVFATVARGEIFELHSGGKVVGELLNPDEKPREKYIVKTPSGGKVTLDVSRVKNVVKPTEKQLEYEKIRRHFPDTVAGQIELAEWCKEHKLPKERKRHLARVIELDPEHREARRLLGYYFLEGEWKTTEQVMRDRGMVKGPQGKWYFPQEIELLEQHRAEELRLKEWRQNIRRWREWLDTERAGEAVDHFRAIQDSFAITALSESLAEEPNPERRKLYLGALANIGAVGAIRELAKAAMRDENEDVRLTALELMEQDPPSEAIDLFLDGLRDKDNNVVNRAAVGLAHMNDKVATGPLIDALVTKHSYKVVIGSPGTSTGFNSNGGIGMSQGQSQRIVSNMVNNPSVLDALVKITEGINFQYDVELWKNWFASQRKARALNGRRD